MKILYDNFEVHKVAEYNDYHGGTFCEMLQEDEISEEAVNIFYTVYGHVPNDENKNIPKGGVEAIADFHNKALAYELCDFLNSLLDKANIGINNRKV